jgi:hypothetical protein
MMREDYGNWEAWDIWDTAKDLESKWPKMTKDEKEKAAECLMEATAVIYDLLGQIE